VLVGLTPGDNK
jgi:D-tyrosyl-tRNA(Tyr) deacylase